MYLAGFGGDVGLELKLNAGVVTDCTHKFCVEFVRKFTSFDQMQNVVKLFAVNESAVSIYLCNRLIG